MNIMRNIFGGGAPFSGGGPFANITNLFQKFSQFIQNPFGALMGMGNLNIPQNLSGNPEAMVQHLRNSGQMSPEQFDQLSQMANTFQNLVQKKP